MERGSFAQKLVLLIFFVICFIPSGFVMGVPVKYVLAVLLLCFALVIRPISVVKASLIFFIFLIILAPSLFIGVESWGGLAIRELQMIVVPFVLAALMYFLLIGKAREKYTDGFRVLMGILFFTLLMKLVICFSVYFGFVSLAGALDIYEAFFASSFVTMEIIPGFPRVFIALDAVIAYIPFFYFIGIRRGYFCPSFLRVIFFLIVSGLVVFISYSRFLWGVYLIGASFLLMVFGGWRLLVCYSVVACLSFYYFSDFFVERLSGTHNSASDSIRAEQFQVLLAMWDKSPWWGQGLGAYDPNYIRSEFEPYSYELQLFSMLPKVGWVFFLVFLSIFAFLVWVFLLGHYSLFLVLVLLIVSGLTNPYLFNSAFSVVYYMLMVIVFGLRERPRQLAC